MRSEQAQPGLVSSSLGNEDKTHKGVWLSLELFTAPSPSTRAFNKSTSAMRDPPAKPVESRPLKKKKCRQIDQGPF